MDQIELANRSLDLLERLEWAGESYEDNACPECEAEESSEWHSDSCELANLIVDLLKYLGEEIPIHRQPRLAPLEAR